MKISNPYELIQKIKLKKNWKIAFFSTLIIGLIVHCFILLNNFPNHDGLYNIYSTQNNIYNGRFFLSTACLFSSYYTLPWVIGIISIFLLSITSVLLIELFDIKKTLNIILISGILSAFPAVASMFSYLFMADGFMLALLLATLSVLILYKYKYGFLIAPVFLSLSLGIYQAYLSFAILLCIIKIILSIFSKIEIKSLFIEIFKDITMLVLSFILYYILLNILLKIENASLSNYQGVDSLQSFSLINIPKGIYRSYLSFKDFIFNTNFFKSNPLILISNICIIISLAYFSIKIYIKNKIYKNWIYNILLFALLIFIPIATNIIFLLSIDTYYHLLMRYHWCLFYILLIILMEKETNNLINWISIISLIFIIFNFYVIDNVAYFNLENKFNKSYNLGSKLVEKIENFEGFDSNMHIAIIGLLNENNLYPSTEITQSITKDITGADGNIILFDPYHYESLFKTYFNFTINYATQEELDLIANSDEFINMPLWPNKDCIKIINNVLTIKLSN